MANGGIEADSKDLTTLHLKVRFMSDLHAKVSQKNLIFIFKKIKVKVFPHFQTNNPKIVESN